MSTLLSRSFQGSSPLLTLDSSLPDRTERLAVISHLDLRSLAVSQLSPRLKLVVSEQEAC